jgi:four helix bundle protein
MKYKRFEDTPVYKASVDLIVRLMLLVEDKHFNGRGDLRDQLQRAGLSISNNIAEGFERGTTNELITFLYYAKGSAGEVRSMLNVCERLPFLTHLKSEISNLRSLVESISRQLQAWADSVQNSGIKGVKYLTDAVRDQAEQARRADALLARIKEINDAAHRQRLEKGSGPPPDDPTL